MASPPHILELPSGTGVLYAVVCDDHKLACFQESANLVQQALQLHGEDANSAIGRQDGQLDEDAAWPADLINALRLVDKEAGALWRLFTVATVKLGSHSGLRAVGIGSNQNKLKRASNLALAFTVARTMPNTCAELQSLASAQADTTFNGSRTAALCVGKCPLGIPQWLQDVPSPQNSSVAEPLGDDRRIEAVARQCDGHLDVVLRRTPTGGVLRKIPNGTELVVLEMLDDSEHTRVQLVSEASISGWVKSTNLEFVDQGFGPSQAGAAKAKAATLGSFDKWLDDSPLDCAKQRLVDFRQRNPCLSPEMQGMLRELIKGHCSMASEWPDSNVAHVIEDLRTVLQTDSWKGDSWGRQWAVAWQKWGAEFTDPSYHFGRGDKAFQNYHWFFGCDPTTVKDLLPPSQNATTGYSASSGGVASPPPPRNSTQLAPPNSKHPPPSINKLASQNATSGYSAGSGGVAPPPPPPRKSTQLAPPSSSKSPPPGKSKPALPPPRAPPACAVPTSALLQGLAPKFAGSAPLAPSADSTSSTQSEQLCYATAQQSEHERDRLREGLNNNLECDGLTIATLTSADTIPLGTDLDPQNQYNNLWGANQTKNARGKLLVQYNLCCRVIDAENVGFSYAQDALGLKKGCNTFGAACVEGVKRAAEHFSKSGIEVIVVYRRKETEQLKLGDGVHLVHAERTDDVMVLRQAQTRNCPIVSRDGFAVWKADLRLSSHLRAWLSESQDIQVRFSWGAGGAFVPDFDLPRPVMRTRPGVMCRDCGQPQRDSVVGRWAHNQWYCDECWRKWMGQKR